MQKHIDLTRQRAQNFASKLAALFYPLRSPVTLAVFSAPGRITYQEAMQGIYRPATVGEKFGPLWSTHWFRVNSEVPPSWQGHEVHLLWNSASEACVWQQGMPINGLTGSYNGYQNILMRGLGSGSAWLPALALLAYTLVFFGLAVWRFRKMEV